MKKFNGIEIDTLAAHRTLRCILEGMIAAWGKKIKCADCPVNTLCSDIVCRMKKFIVNSYQHTKEEQHD